MDSKERILFAYPTLLKEGMSAIQPYPPEALLTGILPTKSYTVIVTAAISLLIMSNTFISIDVYLNGKIITQDGESLDGYQEVMNSTFINDDEIITTTAMHVKHVFFPESGEYEIRTKLVGVDATNNKTQLDSFSCFIKVILSKDE